MRKLNRQVQGMLDTDEKMALVAKDIAQGFVDNAADMPAAPEVHIATEDDGVLLTIDCIGTFRDSDDVVEGTLNARVRYGFFASSEGESNWGVNASFLDSSDEAWTDTLRSHARVFAGADADAVYDQAEDNIARLISLHRGEGKFTPDSEDLRVSSQTSHLKFIP